jgi:hypothetical protein
MGSLLIVTASWQSSRAAGLPVLSEREGRREARRSDHDAAVAEIGRHGRGAAVFQLKRAAASTRGAGGDAEGGPNFRPRNRFIWRADHVSQDVPFAPTKWHRFDSHASLD